MTQPRHALPKPYKYPAPALAANFAGSPSQMMRECSST